VRTAAGVRFTRGCPGFPSPLDERIGRVLAEVRPAPVYREENYVRLHAGRESYPVRGTLAGLEERLDPARFIRVHRSHIVNLASIRELHPWSHGDWIIVLRDGRVLMLRRRSRDRIPELAG
jgi:DNA-binding LytR/AlgR family response regulator